MENGEIDFHHPPETTDPDLLFDILIRNASYLSDPSGRELLTKAYQYAAQAHQGVARDSGEPYIIHPIHAALILSYLQVDAETLAAALLHDVIEDTPATFDDLVALFGDNVARLVEGVTKLNLLSKWSKQKQDAANVLKVIMSMSNDVRVIFVKLADRLHNLRTLSFKRNPESRERTAQEALDVYARIADRLGIAILRKEIEDIAFSYLDPTAYERIKASIENRYKNDAIKIERIQQEVLAVLKKWGVKTQEPEIQPNPRRVYDMHRRLREESDPRQDTLRRVPPQLRFHVIVVDTVSCYMAMAAIHAQWPPIASETRDYISAPLPNGYQSLHTTVFIDRQPIKFQIRTAQMHRTAQLGVIPNMQEGGRKNAHQTLQETIDNLTSLSGEAINNLDDPLEFLNTLKAEELQSEIYVYTPQNEMIKLPVGSTPIDFAYKVHTEVGHQCRGALIDGRWTPLNRPLRTGERVEVLMSSEAEPSFDWLNPDLGYTKSPTAREKIRRWFRRHPRDVQIVLGRDQLCRVIDRLALDASDLKPLVKRWGCKSEREFFLLIGGCQIAIEDVIPDLLDVYGKSQLPLIGHSKAQESIIGVGSLSNTLASCCTPKPGDDIVGYIDPATHLVEVHRSKCPDFLTKMVQDRSRFIAVRWGKVSEMHLACMEIVAHDRPFFLRDVWNILYDQGINVAQVDVQVNRARDATITICIDIESWIQFNCVLTQIEDLPGTIKARRIRELPQTLPRHDAIQDKNENPASRPSWPSALVHRLFASKMPVGQKENAYGLD
ncbi:MAG: bifunctional (p)ppGpp synthetase/guanosine-3',5'-bis(diphosphate) 3'-pyrophosphohydrolase [Anaerolineae bacterium]|nr:bifunctional (p)ppGpp synthetase/guanosine-3',5'-bis(diphosphate) 3'-pyrophosphohydrolase [Anaerolineae bacterium]